MFYDSFIPHNNCCQTREIIYFPLSLSRKIKFTSAWCLLNLHVTTYKRRKPFKKFLCATDFHRLCYLIHQGASTSIDVNPIKHNCLGLAISQKFNILISWNWVSCKITTKAVFIELHMELSFQSLKPSLGKRTRKQTMQYKLSQLDLLVITNTLYR